MAYRVEFTLKAQSDLNELYRWVMESAPHRGSVWLDRFGGTILSLKNFPERSPAVESLSTTEDTVRQLVFGRKRNRYAVYYGVFEDAVRILHVRHGARKAPRRKDLFR